MADTDDTTTNTDSDYPAQAAIWGRFMLILKSRTQPWAKDELTATAALENNTHIQHSFEQIDDVLKRLPARFLTNALVQTGFFGDIEIGKRIIEIHGPINTTLERKGLRNILNGAPFSVDWADMYFQNAETPADIAKVMEWLPEAGLGWMVGAGSEHSVMLQGLDMMADSLTYVRAHSFDGELPHLVSGRVEHPELLLALYERKNQSHFPKAYEKILCWVPEGAIGDFPDKLISYRVEQSVHLKDLTRYPNSDQLMTIPISKGNKQVIDDKISQLDRADKRCASSSWLKFNNLILRTTPALDSFDEVGNMLLSYQASESIKHGFWGRPGMVLCQTSVDFLKKFELGDREPKNHIATEQFVSNYAPIDLIAYAYGRANEGDERIPIIKIGFNYLTDPLITSFKKLVGLLDWSGSIREEVRSVLSKELMSYMTSFYSKERVSSLLPTLYREYGIDNQRLGLSIEALQIQELHVHGFKFSAETVTTLSTNSVYRFESVKPCHVKFSTVGMEDMNEREVQDMQVKALQIGLWLTKAKKLDTVAEVITTLVRRNHLTIRANGKRLFETNNPIFAYRAFLYDAGVDVCVKASKTPGHWKVLAEVFGTDELKPYLDRVNLNVKAKLFTNDLGL